VLLIGYFFPPCNLTAGERLHSWARHLLKFGYYPVVITRRWDVPVAKLSDMSLPTPEEVLLTTHENYESYAVPYHPNIKDRVYTHFGDNDMVLVRKFLTLNELVLQRYNNRFIPYHNIGSFADEFLSNNPDIKKVIITGNPFILFKFGYQLHKKYGVKWIADYRDAWTTSDIDTINRDKIFRMIRKSEASDEKRWVGTASAVTSVSEPLQKKISELVKIPGQWIPNGFELGEFDEFKNVVPFSKFTVTYVGTLYFGQDIEMFCEAFKLLVRKYPIEDKEILFPGLAFYEQQHQRIKNALSGFEKYFHASGRTSKEKILEIEVKSNILLYPAWKGFEGIIPSKIYEYIASGTHTLVAPSDSGEVEKIVKKSGCGSITNTVEETFLFLEKSYLEHLSGNRMRTDLSGENAYFFSRENQAGRMAGILDNI
jgi:glycosyltransferase involved in cell wall biosynthesis